MLIRLWEQGQQLLLLKQSGCPSLRTGSNSGGSFIRVLGFASPSTGVSQPGTIHSDSNSVGCTGGSNSNGFIGGAVRSSDSGGLDQNKGPDMNKREFLTRTAVAGMLPAGASLAANTTDAKPIES